MEEVAFEIAEMKHMDICNKSILAATIGNCIHTLSLMRFLSIAEKNGYLIDFIGTSVPINKLISEIKIKNPNIVVVSYRLSPDVAEELFQELDYEANKNSINCILLLGGTAPVLERAEKLCMFKGVFSSVDLGESAVKIISNAESCTRAEMHPNRLVDYIKLYYPMPLIRHHFGLSSLEETVKGAREIALEEVLDILSIGPDQNAQEFFFHQEEMNSRMDGAGGVPLRKSDDLIAIFDATRCGNYPLLRCYSGTRDLLKWAEMLSSTINVAWGAIPLSWYSQLDGRSNRTISKAIEENQMAIKWYASKDIPVEVNESHQWALRNTSDIIEVATSYIASYNAKKLGVRHYVMQYMFNTPSDISMEMDLAKMLAKIDLIEALHDSNFQSYRMIRTGLASLSQDPNIAKGQLASSITVAMALKPHIVHVVGFSEGNHLAKANEVIESCKIARGVIMNCLNGLPDMIYSDRILKRKMELVQDTNLLLSEIGKFKSSEKDPLIDPLVLTKAIELGLLDAPLLKGNKFAKGSLITKIIDGSCHTINPKTGLILRESDRIRLLELNL